MRKHDINDINLQIEDVDFFYNNDTRISGMIIAWTSNIGWGEYTIFKGVDGFRINSECMDHEEDKDFGRKLLQLLMDESKVTG